jgi:serpin B
LTLKVLCLFSGVTDVDDLYVSAVLQKAFIEVNEEGSEAAAATGVIMMTRMMVLTPQFRCDRPFLYLIKDKLTGLILFGGKVENPSKN